MSDTEQEVENGPKSKQEKKQEEPLEDRIKNLQKTIQRDNLSLEKNLVSIRREELKLMNIELAQKTRIAKRDK
jgi:hypothetical protein